jgi:hypothetical protein
MPPTAEFKTIPPNTLSPSTRFRANHAIGGCRDVILKDKCVKSAFLIKTSQLDVIQGAAKDVGRGVDVRIHQPGNRANRRRWRRKDAALRKHFARIKYHPESGRAGDRNTGLEELPPRSVVARHMIAATAANMGRFGCTRLAATIGEFPSWQIRHTHRSPSSAF